MGKNDDEPPKWEPELFQTNSKETQEACKFLSELIKINTTNPPGNETPAAEYCKKFLENEGFDKIEVIESEKGRGSVICRWKGHNPKAKTLLLLAHLDVVPADPSNWERDPFCGDIEDDYVWGRGSLDCKNMVVAEAMACILLKREGFKPKGDVIMAFTADEEAGGEMGVGYLVRNHWEKVKADYIINEGGGMLLPFSNYPTDYMVQTGEKGVFWTKIKAKGDGGHGSMPIKKENNSMYKIAKITQKIIDYKYPIKITKPVRETMAQISLPKIAKKILLSKRLVRPAVNLAEKITKLPLSWVVFPFVMDIINPTGLKGSDKVNNVPQYTELTIDCRLLPGHDRETLNNYFYKALGKKLFKEIEIIPIEPTQPATVNSIENPFWELVENIMSEMHKGCKLVPMLSAGSTDSKFFRERGSYVLGFCPMKVDPNMGWKEMGDMPHGRNERAWIPNLSYAMEFFYRLVKRM